MLALIPLMKMAEIANVIYTMCRIGCQLEQEWSCARFMSSFWEKGSTFGHQSQPNTSEATLTGSLIVVVKTTQWNSAKERSYVAVGKDVS